MNAVRPGLADPLIGLLGARWALGALPLGLAWLAGGQAVAIGLADGTLALAQAHWDGAATVRPRPGGGVELVPATAPPPPVVRLGVHEGPCLAVAAEPAGGVLSGGQDGRLVRVTADAQTATLARSSEPVRHVAVSLQGEAAWAAGARVTRGDAVLDLADTVTALAFAPDGEILAIAHSQGITLWAAGREELHLPACHQALAWSADATLLASGMAEGGAHLWHLGGSAQVLEGYATAPLSLAFSASAGLLATSGGHRVACWRLGRAGPAVREDCGIGSTQPVVRVACHPARPLIAAGYANGAVLLCQPGSADVLFVREAGGGAVAALAWSPDGTMLALAVEAGEVGVVALPDSMFRAAQKHGSQA